MDEHEAVGVIPKGAPDVQYKKGGQAQVLCGEVPWK